MFERWKSHIRSMRIEVRALWLASKDPRVPWYAQLLVICVVAYALSPIDLIPDFIPVLGHLDDILLVPVGVFLAIRLVPKDVLAECRRRAGEIDDQRHPIGWIGAAFIAMAWIGLLALAGWAGFLVLSR